MPAREVANRRSFSAAALEMSYTQSSVSEAVAALERELGATLLDRSSHPVRVTPAVEIVLSHAEAPLGQAAAIESDLVASKTGDAGRLGLAGFYSAWSTFLPAAVAALARSRPRLRLRQFCQEHGGFDPRLDHPTEDVAMAQPLIAAGLAVPLVPSLNLHGPARA